MTALVSAKQILRLALVVALSDAAWISRPVEIAHNLNLWADPGQIDSDANHTKRSIRVANSFVNIKFNPIAKGDISKAMSIDYLTSLDSFLALIMTFGLFFVLFPCVLLHDKRVMRIILNTEKDLQDDKSPYTLCGSQRAEEHPKIAEVERLDNAVFAGYPYDRLSGGKEEIIVRSLEFSDEETEEVVTKEKLGNKEEAAAKPQKRVCSDGVLYELWKNHAWLTIFSSGPNDSHDGFECLCTFGITWSAGVACCGVFYGSGEDVASTWAVGMLSVLFMLPFSKSLQILLENTDSTKKETLRKIGILGEKKPFFSKKIRGFVLVLSLVCMAVFSFISMVYAVRLSNEREQKVLPDWVISTIQGQIIYGLLLEPALCLLKASFCGSA
uniref:Solute carrier family 40 protein n=1 Tax=Lotharella globosa TaxID=91324 RepID=A0A7S3Z0Z7_9EUKA|mmetsp:Transcript_6834/g.13419  ORF Transcript_6834/g.13419 Transcript_6834/m.13419 type:complete len:385 (+) Transcript_6834:95-1249(+)